MEHVGAYGGDVVANVGDVVAVHVAAVELNPEPVKVNTVLTVPDVGVIITSGVTVNDSSGVASFTGVPFTSKYHEISLVAYGLTTKVPCAIPGVTMEQVEEVIRVLSGAVTTPLNACTLHPVSEGFSPVPTKVTVAPSTALPGDSARVGAPWVTFNTSCAKSPTLGVQPMFPTQPVISITYSPGETLAIMMLPLTIPVPTVTAQAAEPERIGLGKLVLLIEQD
jgi:hypothetical protein